MDNVYIFVAQFVIVIPIVAVIFLLFALPKNQKFRFLKLLIVGAAISFILAKLAEKLISDPRPFVQGNFKPLVPHGNDNGFPSDHTLLASIVGFVVLSVRKKLGWILLIIALLIGLSRMAIGVHHSWDILGAFVISAIGYYLARLIWQTVDKQRNSAAKSA